MNPVILVKFLGFDGPLTLVSQESKFCFKRQHHRGAVGGRNRQAFGAASGHPADVSVLFHAESEGFPPGIILIVVRAACIDTKVTAEGSHFSQLGRGNQTCSSGEGCVMFLDERMIRHLVQGYSGTDSDPVFDFDTA